MQARIIKQKNKATHCVALFLSTYFFPAFFASISLLAAKRAGDLYGGVFLFFLGLSAIIRVMVTVYINLIYRLRE